MCLFQMHFYVLVNQHHLHEFPCLDLFLINLPALWPNVREQPRKNISNIVYVPSQITTEIFSRLAPPYCCRAGKLWSLVTETNCSCPIGKSPAELGFGGTIPKNKKQQVNYKTNQKKSVTKHGFIYDINLQRSKTQS